jgi:hypothetical protein
MTKKQNELIEAIKRGQFETKAQLDHLFRILNGENGGVKQVVKDALSAREDSTQLAPEQVAQGVSWLKNLWKTPAGKERKNNPFGYREQDVLNKDDVNISLRDYYDASRYGERPYYIPLYEVCSAGGSFEYYVFGGQIHIVG